MVETIVIVDAQGALEQLQQEALSRKQLEAADRLILTKTDMAALQDIAVLRATLHRLAPDATQSAASFGSALDLADPSRDTPPISLPSLSEQDAVPIHASQLDLGDTPDGQPLPSGLSYVFPIDLQRLSHSPPSQSWRGMVVAGSIWAWS